MAPPLKRLRQTGDLRLTAEIDYAKLLHEAQVLEESSNFACCLSGDRRSVCAGSSAGVVTTWDLMAEGRPVAATWDAGVGAIYDMAVAGDVVVLGGDRGLGVAAAADVAGGGAPARRLAAAAAPFRNGATPPTAEVNGVALDGGAAWAGGGDGFVRRWDLNTGTCTHSTRAHGDMVLGVCLAREAGVLCSVSEDGTAAFVDGRAPGVARRLPADGTVAAAVRDADAASLPAGARGWCGAVHVDPTATWVTIAGGLDADAAARARRGAAAPPPGGWLATLHAPTGAVVRGGATPAAVRCMSADESTLITGGDEAAVSFWSLNAAQAGCAPRRRQRVDVPAVYALCVAHDLPDLLEDCGIADDDDLGAASVLFAAGAAPVVDVSSGETELFTLAQA